MYLNVNINKPLELYCWDFNIILIISPYISSFYPHGIPLIHPYTCDTVRQQRRSSTSCPSSCGTRETVRANRDAAEKRSF